MKIVQCTNNKLIIERKICKPNMKRKQMPQESKLTSFLSKKSKAQSSSVLTEHGEQSTDQQSAAVALETKVTTHFDSLEPFVTLSDSTPTTENHVFPDVWTTDQWAQKRRISLEYSMLQITNSYV